MGGYCYSFKVTGGLCGFLDCWVYDWVYWGYSWGRVSGVDLGSDVCFVLSGGCLEFYSCFGVRVCLGLLGGILGWVVLLWGWVICINRALVCYGSVLIRSGSSLFDDWGLGVE